MCLRQHTAFNNKSLIVEMLASERHEDIIGPAPLSVVTGLLAHMQSFLLELTNYLLHFSPVSAFAPLISLPTNLFYSGMQTTFSA